MLKILYAAAALLLFLVALAFAALNAAPVNVDYYFGTAELPLVLLLVCALALGALLGTLVGLGRVLRYRRELGRLRRSVRETEQEVRNLRALPLKDFR